MSLRMTRAASWSSLYSTSCSAPESHTFHARITSTRTASTNAPVARNWYGAAPVSAWLTAMAKKMMLSSATASAAMVVGWRKNARSSLGQVGAARACASSTSATSLMSCWCAACSGRPRTGLSSMGCSSMLDSDAAPTSSSMSFRSSSSSSLPLPLPPPPPLLLSGASAWSAGAAAVAGSGGELRSTRATSSDAEPASSSEGAMAKVGAPASGRSVARGTCRRRRQGRESGQTPRRGRATAAVRRPPATS